MQLGRLFITMVIFAFAISGCGDPYAYLSNKKGSSDNITGGGDNGTNDNETGGTLPTVNYLATLLYRNTSNFFGFYEYDHDGNPRPVNNNLSTGNLTGRVQFAQTHTIEPNGNTAKFLPSLIVDRAALLLFTPTEDLNPSVKSITVQVYSNGSLQGTLSMNAPNLIPFSDSTNQGKTGVVYSKKAWSAELAWNWVTPGMELRFTDDSGRTGMLLASDIEYGAPVEGYFVFLRLGMLTDFRKSGSGYMMDDPARAMADYFQTVPFSKLTNVTYENRTLNRIIVSNGTIYDVNSDNVSLRQSLTEGSVYAGDMRADVAKSQVSIGINMANFGIPSSDMYQSYAKAFFEMTIHLAQGKYTNGIQVHGLSGGNGIGTLVDTTGNEFSHEMGHGYGFGHFQRPPDSPVWWQSGNADSGWGYSAYLKRMRANLAWNSDGKNEENNFQKIYNYNSDTMSGGFADSTISKYTHLTGYTAMVGQRNISNYAFPDEKSSTGYYKWNSSSKKREEVRFAGDKGYTGLKPYKIGVPVITLLGGYDPSNYDVKPTAVMYPYFRGNWGNVFHFQEPNFSDKNVCWMEVTFEDGSTDKIGLRASRHLSASVNQFQINIEEARHPNRASLYCQTQGKNPVLLDSQSIPTNLTPMKAPAIIGQANGYSQAYAEDVADTEKTLNKHIGEDLPVLLESESERLLNIYDNIGDLSKETKVVAKNYLNLLYKSKLLAIYMDANQAALKSGSFDALTEAKKLYDQSGMGKDDMLSVFGTLQVKVNGRCLTVEESTDGTLSLNMLPCTTGNPNQGWIFDAEGRFRSQANPLMCVRSNNSHSSTLTLEDCSATLLQRWSREDRPSSWNGFRSVANTNFCFHYDINKNKAVTWPCDESGAGGKDQWSLPHEDKTPALSGVIISPDNFKIIYNNFIKK